MTARKKSRRVIEPIFASCSLHGRPRYDNVLAELSGYTAEILEEPGGRAAQIVYSAKVFAFLRIPKLKHLEEEWAFLQ